MSFKLEIAGKAPLVDYAALTAASFINNGTEKSLEIDFIDDKVVSKEINSSLRLVDGDKTITSGPEVLSHLADKFPHLFLEKSASEPWVKFAYENLTVKDFKKLSVDLEKLDSHLSLRSFIVGYDASVADIAAWGALRANAVMGSVLKNAVYINITRWYQYLESDERFGGVVELLTKSLAEIRKASKAGTKKETHKANFEIDLPDAKDGQVVTRFPPEPSGYLHIGHAKAALLNQYFAKAYHGKLIIRFDDTNPSKEKVEFQDSILEDLELLGIKGDKITYSSNYFNEMYDLAVKMIKEGKAYCDDTPLEQMRAERMDGIKSARRDRTVEENLRVFTEEMKNGTEEGLKNCLRAKIDYSALNKTLRDPVIYRCNLTPHHRTGSEWKMYPTYDFCVPIVDAIEGVTHALRTIEYRDRNVQYEWILQALNLRKVHVWDFARVNFIRTLLSKRKLQWFVDKQYVSNWDDPRFPTVRGIRRRGMSVEGLRNFVISQGPSKNIINLDWNIIWSANKKVIDPIAPRHTALAEDHLVHVKLSKGPEKEFSEDRPKHKKNPDVGTKKVYFSSDLLLEQEDAKAIADGEEVTFMDWGNVICDKVIKEDGLVKEIQATLHLDGDFRKTSKKLTWLAADKFVHVDLVDFDHLITKDKLDEGDNFEDFLTPKTEFHTKAIADVNVKDLKVGDVIQFERKGYFRLDSTDNGLVFFTVPDGKSVNKYGAKA
ncbi:hypothetical protein OGAPHI_001244 [Ogataea philodendri]|uniref:glutamate--tRNA ligase n=1 Tax=Ogataea philodendri TaxID=1378263 RepID=A0A9P8T9L8_9ASCO|nr:uncharacterized protein OGAPHI_001244 [Ogataea philodendri]KAH3670729.1 hypothetical protein OGAPHI_001244 [Ogataea philodendri]